MMYQASKQSSKRPEFTVELIWWGSLQLTPITLILQFRETLIKTQKRTSSIIDKLANFKKEILI